jgi:type 1 glutamine amidotransferase
MEGMSPIPALDPPPPALDESSTTAQRHFTGHHIQSMKRRLLTTLLVAVPVAIATLIGCATATAAPKRALLVTTTTGFRHSSIGTAEQVIAKIAKDSGAFTIAAVASVSPPHDPGRNASDEQKADFKKAQASYNDDIAATLAKTMSPAALKNYDLIIFANTTGDLPLPDKEAFMQWIKNGGAFVGMHSASDTFHGFRPYIDMLGGEFKTHGAQVVVNCINEDPQHPATKPFGASWDIHGKKEEIYEFKSFDEKSVHALLMLAKHPQRDEAGRFPVSWCKMYGKGKVFYTSLGHNEYVWEMPEYQAHILGGIEWATGLAKGSAEPQLK